MKAMILAAGLGTRLKPLTNQTPKALVELHGTTMLEIVIKKLVKVGVDQIIINVHHFAEQIEAYLTAQNNFGIFITLSQEPQILGTGGGLKNAAWFFDTDQPFFLHNVDVLSEVNLEELLQFHRAHAATATMVVQQRQTERFIGVDEHNRFRGRFEERTANNVRPFAFNGIHVLSPEILSKITEQPPFSIIDTYIRLVKSGEKILCFDIGDLRWWDLGKHPSLQEAKKFLEANRVDEHL